MKRKSPVSDSVQVYCPPYMPAHGPGLHPELLAVLFAWMLIQRSLTAVGSWSPRSAGTFSAVSASATLSAELTAALHVERNSHKNNTTQYTSNDKTSNSLRSASQFLQYVLIKQLHTSMFSLAVSYLPHQCRDDIWHNNRTRRPCVILLEMKGHLV